MSPPAPAGFEARVYPDIVRDLLTTLTGGTVRETVVVPAGDGDLVLDRLAQRPLRRVSHLEGVVEVTRPLPEGGEEVVEVPYRFGDADFELVAVAGAETDAIRFRPDGRHPPAGSTVTVNYYPYETRPVPVTDLNVGSVVRTLLESVARELAVEEQLLDRVYRSAFIDTAEGASLDKVVALVGVRRLPAGTPVARVRFSRAPGSTGRVTVPVGTVVSDAEGNRYATLAALVLEPGEPSREVSAAGVTKATPAVEADALDRLEVLIAGIAGVANEAPALVATAPEADEDLRRRARGALHVAARGTVDALRYGLASIPGVKDAAVTEFPNGVPGEVRVDVAYETEGDPDVERAVAERIDDLRPAGVRVLAGSAGSLEVAVTVELTLAGAGVPAAELASLTAGVEERVASHLARLAPGAPVRHAHLVMAALADERIVDARFSLQVGAGTASESLSPPAGTVVRPVRPFTFAPPVGESGGPVGLVTVQVDLVLPVHLAAGVTAADATAAITAAARSHLEKLAAGATVTLDGVAAAIRDDTRFALVRADALVTVEHPDRFLQLTDGTGAYAVLPGEQVRLRDVHVGVREGGV